MSDQRHFGPDPFFPGLTSHKGPKSECQICQAEVCDDDE